MPHVARSLLLLLASPRTLPVVEARVVVEKRSSASLTSPERLLAGGSARFGAQLIMYPADALRTLAQTRTGAKTLAELGTKTLVSGCVTTSAFAFAVGGLRAPASLDPSPASTPGPSPLHVYHSFPTRRIFNIWCAAAHVGCASCIGCSIAGLLLRWRAAGGDQAAAGHRHLPQFPHRSRYDSAH